MEFADRFIVPVRRYLSSLYSTKQVEPYYYHVISSLTTIVPFDVYGVHVVSLSDSTKSLFFGDHCLLSNKELSLPANGKQSFASNDRRTYSFVFYFNGYRIQLVFGRNRNDSPSFSIEEEQLFDLLLSWLPTDFMISLIAGISDDIDVDAIEPDIDFKKYGLTAREIQIANMLVRGMTNAQIGAQLHILEGTVKQHLYRIFNKTGVDSRLNFIHLWHEETENHVDS